MTRAHYPTLPPELAQVIARFEEQFERALLRNENPRIEKYVRSVPTGGGAILLQKLLALEINYRRQLGQNPLASDYTARFPEHATLVDEILSTTLAMQLPRDESTLAETTGATAAWVSTAPTEEAGRPAESGKRAPAVRRFGDYDLLEQLGQGGMGVVYRARQRSADRVVALKVIRPDRLAGFLPEQRASAIERFRREAQAAARLEDDHLVTVYDVGEVGGCPYYAMRFVKGSSLKEVVDVGPLKNESAARYMLHAARGLQAAHEANILHRDLKPANIMVDEKTDRAMLADFGLAKLQQADRQLTESEAVMGSPPYMSPEQARDASGVDHLSDVYGLGATLYHLLAGRPPFQSARPVETLLMVQHQDPIPPRRLNPSVDQDIETITLKCLEKEPWRRYRSAKELAEELERYLSGLPIHARPVGPVERSWRWCRRNPLVASVALAVVFLLAAFVVHRQTRPAYLEISTTPADATVVLNDREIALDHGQALVQSRPGKFSLEVQRDGYRPFHQEVALVRGRGNAVMLNVELRSSFGFLTLSESAPANAYVALIDSAGKTVARGAAPFNSPRLPAGTYTLRVWKEHFQPQEQSVTIPDGDRTMTVDRTVLTSLLAGMDSFEQFRFLRRQLARPIAKSWKFEQVPLGEAVASISRDEDMAIRFDITAFRNVGINATRKIAFASAGGSLDANLRRLLEGHGLLCAPRLKGDDMEIVIYSPLAREGAMVQVVYAVSDIIQSVETPDLAGAPGLIHGIVDTIAPGHWLRTWQAGFVDEAPPANGLRGRITFQQATGTISVLQTWAIQNELYDYLEQLRAGTAKVPPLPKVADNSLPKLGGGASDTDAAKPGDDRSVPMDETSSGSKVTTKPPMETPPDVRPVDGETIYNLLRIRNARVSKERIFHGDAFSITYELANTSGKDLQLPPGSRVNLHVPGLRDHWLEFLDPEVAKRMKRKKMIGGVEVDIGGPRLALGGASIVAENPIRKDYVMRYDLPFARPGQKSQIAPGKYRFIINYKPNGRLARPQQLTVDFEILPREGE